MVIKVGISSQAVTSVWVRLPKVKMLKTRPNMTLAVNGKLIHNSDFESECGNKQQLFSLNCVTLRVCHKQIC